MKLSDNLFSSFSWLVAASIAFASLQGCSPGDDLTRASAQRILNEYGNYPREETQEFDTFRHGWHESTKYVEEIEELKQSGLVAELTIETKGVTGFFTVHLTERGQSFVRGEEIVARSGRPRPRWVNVVIYEASIGGVTGISYRGDDRSVAIVEYTEIREPTPFGQHRWYQKQIQEGVDRKAVLRLYDDGWRVEKVL